MNHLLFLYAKGKFSKLKLAFCLFVLLATTTSFNNAENEYLIVIDKSDYQLTLYRGYNVIAVFRCTFGCADQGKKEMQGDRKTPEGTYRIIAKKPHEKWNKFLSLDYPNIQDRQEFVRKKAAGLLPPDAKIGGDIGIHGTWPDEEFAVDNLQAWTLGCISVKNCCIDSVYNYVEVGTKVVIKK